MRPEWKKLKADSDWRKDQRFLKALDYIANTTYTYTHTLGRDTYPVALTKEGLLEGTALFTPSRDKRLAQLSADLTQYYNMTSRDSPSSIAESCVLRPSPRICRRLD